MIVIDDKEEEKNYMAFKVQQHYLHIEHINNLSLQFITEMLLCDKVKIQSIPFELRIAYKTFYLSAFRVSRNISKERFMDESVTGPKLYTIYTHIEQGITEAI